VIVVRGGSTRKQPEPLVCTQYHQLPPVVTASQARDTLLSVVAVIRRFVGAFAGGGLFAAGAAEVNRSADASNTVASAAFRKYMR
jgi:hypothetical protein